MFHHCHGENHPVSQDSMIADNLDRMLGFLKRDFKISNIEEFIHDAKKISKLTRK